MATEQQMDSLKFVSDWSKWLVAVQTGSTGFVATFLKPDVKNCAVLPSVAKVAFIVAAVAIAVGITAAGAAQSSLPNIVTGLRPEDKIWDEDIYFLNRSFGKFWVAVELQFGMFLLGTLALLLCLYSLLG